MTSTKVKKTKLIVREKEFAQLISERKKLAESLEDIKSVIKGLDEQIFGAMVKENLTEVSVDGIGLAKIVTIGGSVTWDQGVLSNLLIDEAKARNIDSADLIVKICALKARPGKAKDMGINVTPAKIVGAFTDKIVVE